MGVILDKDKDWLVLDLRNHVPVEDIIANDIPFHEGTPNNWERSARTNDVSIKYGNRPNARVLRYIYWCGRVKKGKEPVKPPRPPPDTSTRTSKPKPKAQSIEDLPEPNSADDSDAPPKKPAKKPPQQKSRNPKPSQSKSKPPSGSSQRKPRQKKTVPVAHVPDEEKNDKRESKLTEKMDKKFLATVRIHIDNLCAPPKSYQVRSTMSTWVDRVAMELVSDPSSMLAQTLTVNW